MTRCPNCKRVFCKNHVSRAFERIEKRPWEWRVETKYFYLDGSYKNSTFSEWRKRIERIKIFKNVKECRKCGYKWTEKEEVNLDKGTRPQTTNTRRTRYRNPHERNERGSERGVIEALDRSPRHYFVLFQVKEYQYINVTILYTSNQNSRFLLLKITKNACPKLQPD